MYYLRWTIADAKSGVWWSWKEIADEMELAKSTVTKAFKDFEPRLLEHGYGKKHPSDNRTPSLDPDFAQFFADDPE